jgi:hypothetical protein
MTAKQYRNWDATGRASATAGDKAAHRPISICIYVARSSMVLTEFSQRDKQYALQTKRDGKLQLILRPGSSLLLTVDLTSISCPYMSLYVSRVSQSVYCLTADWTAGVRFSTETEDFSSTVCVQTGSGAHPASYTVGTGGKARPGRDADHSPPYSAEF